MNGAFLSDEDDVAAKSLLGRFPHNSFEGYYSRAVDALNLEGTEGMGLGGNYESFNWVFG